MTDNQDELNIVTRKHLDLLSKAFFRHDNRGQVQALFNLGFAHLSAGKPIDAKYFYEQALEISHLIADRRFEGMSLAGLGMAYEALGEPHRAIDYLIQALEKSQRTYCFFQIKL